MCVPNTSGARLAKELIKGESSLARMTKYNVKIVEQSSTQLCRLFQRIMSPNKCAWEECPVCELSETGKSSKCRASNVVYEARCLACVDLVEKGIISENEVGVYKGETSRTLMERAVEHLAGAKNVEIDNFITKHWAQRHNDLEAFPQMKFSVLRQCKDALTRQVTEAVLIEMKANLNSKAEWGKNTLSRLSVQDVSWKSKEEELKADKKEEGQLLNFISRKKSSSTSPTDKHDPQGAVDVGEQDEGGDDYQEKGCLHATLIQTDVKGGEDIPESGCPRATLIQSTGRGGDDIPEVVIGDRDISVSAKGGECIPAPAKGIDEHEVSVAKGDDSSESVKEGEDNSVSAEGREGIPAPPRGGDDNKDLCVRAWKKVLRKRKLMEDEETIFLRL